MSRKIVITTPIQLYRHLCRKIRQLPVTAQEHYRHRVRQGFNSHCDETDPERIRQIIERSIEDAEWVVKKYSQNSSTDRSSTSRSGGSETLKTS